MGKAEILGSGGLLNVILKSTYFCRWTLECGTARGPPKGWLILCILVMTWDELHCSPWVSHIYFQRAQFEGLFTESCASPVEVSPTELYLEQMTLLSPCSPGWLCLTQGTSCTFHKAVLKMAVYNGNNCFILPLRWENRNHSRHHQVTKKTENMQGYLEKPLISPSLLFKVNLNLKEQIDFWRMLLLGRPKEFLHHLWEGGTQR